MTRRGGRQSGDPAIVALALPDDREAQSNGPQNLPLYAIQLAPAATWFFTHLAAFLSHPNNPPLIWLSSSSLTRRRVCKFFNVPFLHAAA